MILVSEETEKRLIASLRNGNHAARRSFYEQYRRYLAAVCARYVPDNESVKDLLQEVFIKLYTRFDRFEYRGPGSLQAWCRRVAVNESLLYLRNGKRFPQTSLETIGDLPEPDETPAIETIPQATLLSMIQRLPERYRTVFNLYVFEEMSHREIASLLQIGESTSASNLHRAKAILTKWIKEYVADER
ncbi:MAG: sigma-70 family RNA polymerase sigma factor [Bacteroidales bacterium]|jgi:RNA polymerase sigma-70 factor (ECF subfamily)|nr:sigma-70 family RNA polymerase sigma factor [Bacteroidales bacterium]